MAYDDLKEFGGKVYSGMSIGSEHVWEYPEGLWKERKVAPDRWIFTFSSLKRRVRRAPEGSGAPVGTGYHWFLLAHQIVRKRDKDTYETFMEGAKFKIAHRRPHWRSWSTEYPDHEPEREILIRILEEELEHLKSGGPSGFRMGLTNPSQIGRASFSHPASKPEGGGCRDGCTGQRPEGSLQCDSHGLR